MNTNKLDTAIEVFRQLLEYRSDLPAAHLGTGSAYAMSGRFNEAISSFTLAITCDSTIADAWKRRGQTRAAIGLNYDAVKDLTKAAELGTDPDTYFQRGSVYFNLKNFPRSLEDFNVVLESNNLPSVQLAQLHNYIGICEGQLGDINASINSHSKALKIDPTFKEAAINYAQMYKV